MRSLFIVLVSLLAVPSTAFGAGLSAVARDVPAGRQSAAPRFNLVGLHWQGSGEVSFRTKAIGGRWSGWREAAPEAEDAPDPGREGGRPGWRIGNPYWTGASNRLQIRTHGRVRRVRAQYVWSPAGGVPPRSISVADSPLILSRLAWGANERIRRGRTRYADALRFAIVHHTAGSNTYTRTQSAAIVRGIQLYHVRSNGWDDIGYNFLVDKYGQVFEGRFGGIDRNVVGAHAAGFNTGSVGVALFGNYDAGAVTPAARTALTRLLAWRLDVGHLDPISLTNWTSTGNPRFPTGAPVTLRAISGHRDTGFTSCPGGRLYGELNNIGRMVSELGLPKLYSPRAVGGPGGLVRFTARLTEPLPWSVVVTDQSNTVVATGEGEGTAVDWVWDARTVPAGRYTYAIDAGPTVRPATGIVSGTIQRAALTALARPALITPNGDGRQETTTVEYKITAPATMTATVVDSLGAPLAVLFTAVEARRSSHLPLGRSRCAGRPLRDPALRAERRRHRDDRDGDRDRQPSARRRPGRAPGVLAERRRAVGHDASSGSGSTGRLASRSPCSGRGRRSARSSQARARVALRRSSGTAASPGAWAAASTRSSCARRTPVSTVVQSVDFALDLAAPKLLLVSAPQLRFSINEPADLTVTLDGSRIVRVRRLTPGRFTVPSGGAFTSIRAVARDFAGNETAPLLR